MQGTRPAATLLLLIGNILCWSPASTADKPASFAEVQRIIEVRCQSCHSEMPTQQDLYEAPKGVKLDDAEEIKAYAGKIMEQAVQLKLMPPGNLTQITDEERAEIASWVSAGANVDQR